MKAKVKIKLSNGQARDYLYYYIRKKYGIEISTKFIEIKSITEADMGTTATVEGIVNYDGEEMAFKMSTVLNPYSIRIDNWERVNIGFGNGWDVVNVDIEDF